MKFHAKCTGCKALVTAKGSYSCRLGFEISYLTHGITSMAPRPVKNCPKPKTFQALKQSPDAKPVH